MFEAIELHKKIPKKQFDEEVQQLRTELLQAQYALQGTDASVIVIVSGVEGAGKSEVVNRLNEWLDTRWIRNHAFWDESDEERMRPHQWRFWRTMPARGTMAVMFGSWYTQPIINHALGKAGEAELDVEMSHIEQLERMLTDDGHLIIKLWYHLSKDAQQEALKSKEKYRITKMARRFAKSYKAFAETSARAIRLTDTGNAPWYLIDAEDRRYRDLKTAKVLLQSLQEHLQRRAIAASEKKVTSSRTDAPVSGRTVFDNVDVDKKISDKDYRKQLKKYQEKLSRLAWQAYNSRRSLVAVFEGWDAAGKGGAIRRVTSALDARLYSVISVAAPTDEERARHYLWRFWRHLPRDGYVTLYDRSWYGRVLVERVEGFAAVDEWMRSYQEINDFEEQLHRHGTALAKVWVHISPEEQLRRFKEREVTPWKMHKITDEDWRNREKWDDYAQAVTEMVARTSTTYSPWTIIPGNDKKVSRLEVVKTLCKALEEVL